MRMRPSVARVRKRQYVRARRSRYSGDHIASIRSAGSTTSADCTERTAPVSRSISVASSTSRTMRSHSGSAWTNTLRRPTTAATTSAATAATMAAAGTPGAYPGTSALDELDDHLVAGQRRAFAGGHDREAVGAEHRAELMRPLRPGRRREAVVQPDAHALVAVGVAGDRRIEVRHDPLGLVRGALQRAEGGAHEEDEGDHRGDGVAGKAEDERVAARAKPGGA